MSQTPEILFSFQNSLMINHSSCASIYRVARAAPVPEPISHHNRYSVFDGLFGKSPPKR